MDDALTMREGEGRRDLLDQRHEALRLEVAPLL